MSEDTRDLMPEDETVDPELDPPGKRRTPKAEGQPSPEDAPDRIRVDDDAEDEEDEAPEEPDHTELTEQDRESFRDLLTVGRRTKTVELFDHKVVLASLNVDDEVMIGQATKSFVGSQTFPRAWQSATVAASIRSVDGEAWGQSMFADEEPEVRFESKWAKVRRMYPLVVQALYNEVTTMEAEFAELARKLGKV